MLSNSTKQLRAERYRLITNAQLLTDTESPTGAEQFDKMLARADALSEKIRAAEAADAAAEREFENLRRRALGLGISENELAARDDKEDRAFEAWARGGETALSDEQRSIFAKSFRAAQSVGTDTEGGYTVPEGFYQRLIEAQKSFGGMLNAGLVFDTATGNDLPVPTDNDAENKGAILGENAQAAQQDVTFGSVTLGAYTYTSKIILVSNQLLQDAAFDLNAFLASILGTRIARAINTDFTTGDGTGKPQGVIAAATLGITAASATALAYDDMIDMEHSVDPLYRRKATWMLSDSGLREIAKIKDSNGRPLWLPGLDEGEPDTICGYPYIVNQDMDDAQASSKPIAFGDFSNYFIRRVAGARVLRLTERYADFNQVGFVAFQRWDGDLIDAGTHPVKYLEMAAS
jgi:HK97 family phage major capsid protein